MLKNIKSLHGQTLSAIDGDIGHVEDFYFDDKTWAIRYLVTKTGSWLTQRRVLISPHSLGRPGEDVKKLAASLSRQQIKDSPPFETDKPISRQYEIGYYSYYGLPAYWYGGGVWGRTSYPAMLPFSPAEEEASQRSRSRDDCSLHSISAVLGYTLQAIDGEIGSVCGFMLDDMTWTIGDLIADTGHWFSGKEILLPTALIERVIYEESKVYVNLTLAALKATKENEVAAAGGGRPVTAPSQS